MIYFQNLGNLVNDMVLNSYQILFFFTKLCKKVHSMMHEMSGYIVTKVLLATFPNFSFYQLQYTSLRHETI